MLVILLYCSMVPVLRKGLAPIRGKENSVSRTESSAPLLRGKALFVYENQPIWRLTGGYYKGKDDG